jgi:steroid delta-isomerase-like uncharacterized protein
MTPQETEAVADRWHRDLIMAGNVALAEEILTPDVVVHANGREVHGLANVSQLAIGLRAAIPDIRITHDETLVAGDRVAIRWTNEGTHQGPYFGVPASGKRLRFEGLDLVHVRDGKIAALWIAFDNYGVLQQMGAVPASG